MDDLASRQDVLCPFSERREKSELFWSLFMTAVTAATARAHLENSVKKQKPWTVLVQIAIFLFFPVYIFIEVVAPPLLTLLFYILLAHDNASELNPVEGEERAMESTPSANIWDSSMIVPILYGSSDCICFQVTNDLIRVGGMGGRSRRVGRIVLQALALAQAVCGTIKGLRRLEVAGASTLLDQHMTWMNVGGAAVLILCIAAEALGISRTPCKPSASAWKINHYMVALVAWFAVFVSFQFALLSGTDIPVSTEIQLEIASLFPLAYAPIYFNPTTSKNTDTKTARTAQELVLILGAASLGACLGSMTLMMLAPFRWYPVRTIFLVIWTLILCGITVSSVLYFYLVIRSYCEAFFIEGDIPWPEDKACPQLWKDDRWLPTF